VPNGGREKSMCDEDIHLEHHWSPLAVINHTTTMTSLAFEHLAENDNRITFLHAFPRLTAPESSGIAWRVTLASIRGLVAIVMLIFGISAKDSGKRHAFHLTSDRYSPGAWRIDSLSDQVSAPDVLEQYRDRGWPEKVWEHTVRVFDKALDIGSDSVPN
jgi:hypothetical protein